MRGPIDYIVIGFKGNKFDGSVLRALEAAVDQGTIGLVALSFITKDDSGNIATVDIAESGDSYIVDFAQRFHVDSSLVSNEDIDETGELLENNTSAGLLVIEQLWAKPLKKALIDANGFLIAEGRIHPDAALEIDESEEE